MSWLAQPPLTLNGRLVLSDFPCLMSVTENIHQLEARVLSLVRDEVLETPAGFTVESDLFDAGLDSMAIMQLLLVLEEHYGVAIPVGMRFAGQFQKWQSNYCASSDPRVCGDRIVRVHGRVGFSHGNCPSSSRVSLRPSASAWL